MRLTIIPSDGTVIVDGEAYTGLDLTILDQSIHAVQWYGTQGEIEFKDPSTGNMTGHSTITTIDQFQSVIELWQTAKQIATAPKE